MKKLLLLTVLSLMIFSFGTVSAIECSEADYDGDGDVGFEDLFEFRQHYNGSCSSDACSFWDFGNDGFVGDDDLASFNEWYQKACPLMCLDVVDYVKIRKLDGYTMVDSDSGKSTVQVTVGANGARDISLSGVRFDIVVDGITYVEHSTYPHGVNEAKVYPFQNNAWKNYVNAEISVSAVIKNNNTETVCGVSDSIKIMKNISQVIIGDITGNCSDSDNGEKSFVKGVVSTDSGSYEDYCFFYDGDDGFPMVKEHYCDDGAMRRFDFSCGKNGLCEDGACVEKNETEDDGPKCEDSDGGMYYYDYGEISGLVDACSDAYTLNEFYCTDSDEIGSKIYKCPNGCEDGRCVEGENNETFPDLNDTVDGCENNFECDSNVCVDGQCVSAGFFKRVLNWFSRWFS